jgi:hypothetical protein
LKSINVAEIGNCLFRKPSSSLPIMCISWVQLCPGNKPAWFFHSRGSTCATILLSRILLYTFAAMDISAIPLWFVLIVVPICFVKTYRQNPCIKATISSTPSRNTSGDMLLSSDAVLFLFRRPMAFFVSHTVRGSVFIGLSIFTGCGSVTTILLLCFRI